MDNILQTRKLKYMVMSPGSTLLMKNFFLKQNQHTPLFDIAPLSKNRG